ncbi:MAG: DUF177 domain-containing protein [Desulfobacterales bacterium]
MMRIRTEDLKAGELRLKFEERPETFDILAEMAADGIFEFPAPLNAALRARLIGDMVEIDGSFSTAVRLDCARCLQSFEMPLTSSFALTYRRTEPAAEQSDANPEELELTSEDIGLIYYQGEEINIDNEIQEQVVLAFPIRALCKPDCRGLCPACGADLNSAECGCNRLPPNKKFAALKNLKLK